MQSLGVLERIWRYPVKSLAREALESAVVQMDGIAGDRAAALIVREGHARAGKAYRGKEHNRLHTTREPQDAAMMAQSAGVRVELEAAPGARYFDDAPISLIFDRWIDEVSAALGETLDPQRWRPNFYARAYETFTYTEDQLVGTTIEIGSAVLRVRSSIGRCVTTTYDVQTGERFDDVLLYVAQRRGNSMGVYCDVEETGEVRAGDVLRLRER